MQNVISLSSPHIGQREKDAVLRVLDSAMLAQGPEVAAFEQEFAAATGAEHAVALNSGTSALHIALLASGIGPGDEVIVPSFTFAATANVVSLCGATPVFVDIEYDTFCLSVSASEAAITEKTKAIMPVHLYGHPADMSGFETLCDKHGLTLFEDAAQAHLASQNGKQVGTFATSMFSFYPTKNMHSGEGGMLTTADAEVARKARLYRNQGMEIRYANELVGFNLRMTDIHASIGRVQLEQLPEWTKRRQEIAKHYNESITTAVVPITAPNCEHVYHQYTLRVTGGNRDLFIEYLRENDIGCGVYYPTPVHRLPSFDFKVELEQTELAAQEAVSIPVHPKLTDVDVERVVEVINQWS